MDICPAVSQYTGVCDKNMKCRENAPVPQEIKRELEFLGRGEGWKWEHPLSGFGGTGELQKVPKIVKRCHKIWALESANINCDVCNLYTSVRYLNPE